MTYFDRANKAHAKGFVLVNVTSGEGIWITHSVPEFTEIVTEDGRFGYPNSGKRKGQHFFCVSLDATSMSNLGEYF